MKITLITLTLLASIPLQAAPPSYSELLLENKRLKTQIEEQKTRIDKMDEDYHALRKKYLAQKKQISNFQIYCKNHGIDLENTAKNNKKYATLKKLYERFGENFVCKGSIQGRLVFDTIGNLNIIEGTVSQVLGPKEMIIITDTTRRHIKNIDTAGLVDDSYIKCCVKQSGTYSYTTIMGTKATIKSYVKQPVKALTMAQFQIMLNQMNPLPTLFKAWKPFKEPIIYTEIETHDIPEDPKGKIKPSSNI